MDRRTSLLAALSVAACLLGTGAASAGEPAIGVPGPEKPLAQAVREFNTAAPRYENSKGQPPLTEDEVVAAIRAANQNRAKYPLNDEEFAKFRRVAENRRLPEGAAIELITRFEGGKTIQDAWSIRVRLEFHNRSYALAIRDTRLGTRQIGPEELKVIAKYSHPLGSFERMEYQKERREAAARDRDAKR